MKTYLVTGAAGFIGANFIKHMLAKYDDIKIVVLDLLTYAGNLGTIAEEDVYKRQGQTGKLYNIKADYLLLFFYNPDCHACQEITRQMESSFLINEFSKSNKLKILAVYPDEDLDAWKEHVSVMPKDWINSYDKSVSLKNDEIYDLKAIPTLYLLNKEKKVLLKDATFQQIENYLLQTTN